MNESLHKLNISEKYHAYTNNLSVAAEKKDRLPFIGREKELEAVMETLLRKLRSNLLLVGKPGVGKTALITELAHRINTGKVPVNLQHKVVLEIAINAFLFSQDSTDLLMKEFEAFFGELKKSRDSVILFLDELQIQTMASGGKQNQYSHIQKLLKNIIANRELTIISATTPENSAKYFKSDDVLASSFAVVMVNEPEKDEQIDILTGIKDYFETYYHLKIAKSLFEKLYHLAQRFIPHRAFPDKAIELLDISCSKASLKNEKSLSVRYIYQSIADFSKLPIAIVQKDPQLHYHGIEEFMKQNVVNQIAAIEEISRILRLARLDTHINAIKPEGIFLFLGPTGSGKSFIAGKLAEYLYGNRDKLQIINLNAFSKAEDAERLVYDKLEEAPGILAVKAENHPFSVILFENIEEAHPAVLAFLGATLTRGEIIDPLGKHIFLSNIIFILSLTSIGEERKEAHIGFLAPKEELPQIVIAPKIMNVLDWVDEIIEFTPLDNSHLRRIAKIRIEQMTSDIQKRFKSRIKIDDNVIEAIVRHSQSSGRFAYAVSEFIDREIKMRVMDAISSKKKPHDLNVHLKSGHITIEHH